MGGWPCAHSRPLWVSPTNSPMRLEVSPAAASTPTRVFNQRFEALFPRTGTLGCRVCQPVHQLLPCRPAAALPSPLHNLPPPGSASHRLVMSPLRPAAHLCPPLLPVWVSVSSLSPWLSDFHTVRFSVTAHCFFVFKLLLSFCCVRRHSVSTYVSILAGSL